MAKIETTGGIAGIAATHSTGFHIGICGYALATNWVAAMCPLLSDEIFIGNGGLLIIKLPTTAP